MPVIIIFTDSFPEGHKIAQRVAEVMGYRYLRRNLLPQVAKEYGMPEEELVRSLDAPLGIFTGRSQRQKALAYIQTACLEELLADDVVCYGLAAHLYVRGVSHALKVRILTPLDQRANRLVQDQGLLPKQALKLAQRQQKEQRRWSLETYKLDQTDPALYDLVISLDTLEEDEAVDIICDTAGYRKFEPMTYSRKCMQDKTLASRVYQRLMEPFPDTRVEAKDGTVVVYLAALKRNRRKKQEAVRQIAEGIPGVRYLEVHVINDYFGQAAQSER